MNRPPVLVLTAGLGTRLRPLTYLCAKGAVPVNGEALACRVARWLASHGFTNQVFNLHHHPESIASAVGDGSGLGIRARYSWENPVLGSAGGPRHALPLLRDGGDDVFLIVNGDTLTNVDPVAVLRTHRESGSQITMALIPNPAPDKYGGVLVDDSGFVTGFSRRGVVRESYHFIGVQASDASVFERLADNVPYESVGRLYMEMLAARPHAIRAFISNASFHDIGTPADYLHTSLELASDEGDRLVSRRADVRPGAAVRRTIVWDDVSIDPGAHLTNCIVAGGARVPAGAYSNCAIIGANGFSPADGEQLTDGLLVRTL